MKGKIQIDKMPPNNWVQVREIYLERIPTRNTIFQKEAPTWKEWDNTHLTTNFTPKT